MNIKEAKQEIIDTVQAYLMKDETGAYAIPVEKQRPILLMGPPGIGKTAIMEQVARECGINLVSYTITHHTRQSAIGLPFIVKKNYEGKEYSVTEYTMSEIVASIYDQIEHSHIREGILFLDEINCVSETLAPTMLQFLQYKTFGTHRVPEGFIIVTAGNPPEYNKSVRDFDIVTLDRVKRIDVEENFDVWKEYAYKAGIHGSILAYLEIKKQNFYSIRTEVSGRKFVTARGWEDLSRIIAVYEKLGKPVKENLIVQYVQDPEIARDFANYYELYNKYRNVYHVPDILNGTAKLSADSLKNAPFDEKLSLIGLLIESLNGEFRAYAEDLEVQRTLAGTLKTILGQKGDAEERIRAVHDAATAMQEDLDRRTEAKLLGREEIRQRHLAIAALQELEKALEMGRISVSADNAEEVSDERTESAGVSEKERNADSEIRHWFAERENSRQNRIREADDHLTNAFRFLDETYGEGQEMVMFLSELAGDYYSLKFVRECGNDAYYKYNKLLLLQDQRSGLQDEIRSLITI